MTSRLGTLPGSQLAHSTPLSLQKSRGTCWIFATLAVLEQSYRATGVAKGWLKPEEYVRMSPQAYGAAVLLPCFGNALVEVAEALAVRVGLELWAPLVTGQQRGCG